MFDYLGAVPKGDWAVSRLYAILVFEKMKIAEISEPLHPYDKYRFFYPTSPEYEPSYLDDHDGTSHATKSSSLHQLHMDVVPTSPDFPPDDQPEEDQDDEDTALMQMLQRRAKAIQLAGGQDAWDALSEEQMGFYLAKASGEGQEAIMVPSSPEYPPPESMVAPTSPDYPPPYYDGGFQPTSPDYPPP